MSSDNNGLEAVKPASSKRLLASALGETAASVARSAGMSGRDQAVFVGKATAAGSAAGWSMVKRTAKESDGGKRG